MRSRPAILVLSVLTCIGCGTTKWSDTRRTATEQLLISDAMDRAISRLDFDSLAGKPVYLDSAPVKYTTDAAYMVSALRQHMLASGCVLKDDRGSSDYVVEVRAGAVGTDRRELLFGVPATKIPSMIPVPGVPANLPEMPLATKTEQRGVVKIGVFAYNRKTGRPLWQSGSVPVESTAKDLWLLGAGPFQRGTIYEGTEFAGKKIRVPLVSSQKKVREKNLVSVAKETHFPEPPAELPAGPKELIAKAPDGASKAQAADKKPPTGPTGPVLPASHNEPVTEKPKPKPAATTPKPKPNPKPAPSSRASTAGPFDQIIPASYVNLPLPPKAPRQSLTLKDRSKKLPVTPRPPVPPRLLPQR